MRYCQFINLLLRKECHRSIAKERVRAKTKVEVQRKERVREKTSAMPIDEEDDTFANAHVICWNKKERSGHELKLHKYPQLQITLKNKKWVFCPIIKA